MKRENAIAWLVVLSVFAMIPLASFIMGRDFAGLLSNPYGSLDVMALAILLWSATFLVAVPLVGHLLGIRALQYARLPDMSGTSLSYRLNVFAIIAEMAALFILMFLGNMLWILMIAIITIHMLVLFAVYEYEIKVLVLGGGEKAEKVYASSRKLLLLMAFSEAFPILFISLTILIYRLFNPLFPTPIAGLAIAATVSLAAIAAGWHFIVRRLVRG